MTLFAGGGMSLMVRQMTLLTLYVVVGLGLALVDLVIVHLVGWVVMTGLAVTVCVMRVKVGQDWSRQILLFIPQAQVLVQWFVNENVLTWSRSSGAVAAVLGLVVMASLWIAFATSQDAAARRVSALRAFAFGSAETMVRDDSRTSHKTRSADRPSDQKET